MSVILTDFELFFATIIMAASIIENTTSCGFSNFLNKNP